MKFKIDATQVRDFSLLVATIVLAVTFARVSPQGAHADTPNRAGLVVRFGDGSLVTRCVEFSGADISGYDLLERSGLDIVAAFDSGQGAAVCQIEREGCPAADCLTCAYPNYWAYWHLADGDWAYSQAGASGYRVHDGDVEGWSWGAGDPPPVVPFDQICAPPPTNTPSPTNTPLPTNTPPPPTGTPVPPTATLSPAIPTATLAPQAPVVWFRLDRNPIPAGTCTTVRWDTSHVQKVYLDGERVDSDGSREVCPTAPQEYRLRIESAAGEQVETLTLGVIGAPPSPTAVPQPTTPPSPSPSTLAQPATATTSPFSPALQPAADPSPSPSPAALPPTAASLPPSSTPERVALASAPLSSTRATQSQPPGTAQPTRGDQGTVSASLLGYITFNFTMIGLLSWLIVRMLHRR